MYSLLVVDDEEEIRNGIIQSIDWNQWGYEVIGEAENGKIAIERIKEKKPDIVLTDVKMPEMDGIELMQYLHENHPGIQIIVLSGYSDFKYLNMSIKNEVADYLLKPTDLNEFEQTFRELKIKLDQNNKEKMEQKETELSLQQRKAYIRQTLLNQLIHGDSIEQEKFVKDAETAGLRVNFCSFYVFVISLHHNARYLVRMTYEEKFQLKNQIIETINALFQVNNKYETIVFLSPYKKITGIINADMENKERTFYDIQHQVFQKFGIQVSIGISDICKNKESTKKGYEEGRTVLYNQHCGGRICFYADMKGRKADVINKDEIPLPDEQTIINVMMQGKEEELRDIVYRFFSYFKEGCLYNNEDIDVYCMKLLLLFSDCIEKIGINYQDFMRDKDLSFEKMFDIDSIIGKRNFIIYIVEELGKRFAKRKNDYTNNKLLTDIKEYIDAQYCSEILSLNMVAEHVERSPAYVSKIFKEYFDVSFIQYVRKKRMEKSLELLQEGDLLIYEVAYEVGYPDVSNFVKIFKKYHGITPTDYQKIFITNK